MNSTPATPTPDQPATPENGTAVVVPPPATGSTSWTVSLQLFGYVFTSVPLARTAAEKLQDHLEAENQGIVWLDPILSNAGDVPRPRGHGQESENNL